MTKKLTWKVYSIVLGIVTTVVAQKAVTGAWRVATGDEPPDPNDPSTPAMEAAIWALASGLGLGVAQLATNRFLGHRRIEHLGTEGPSKAKA